MTLIWRCDVQSNIKMGGGGGKGGGSSGGTTTSTTLPPAYLQDAYTQLLSKAQNVANTPYTPYSGQLVAGFTPDQQSAFNTVNQTQGISQPYTQQATSDVNSGTQSIYPQLQQYNSSNLSQYENPYTNDVINSTMALANQQDAQQQSSLSGNAIQSGASPFGGDRAGVAAAALAGQQNLANNQTIAGLENQNFTQAQSELNNQQQLQANTMSSDAWRQLSGGQELGALGTQAQNNALTGASAQLQSGALQQQLNQENLNVPYEQYQAQQAYPFQTTNWLAGIETGLGGVSGGTSSTTAPSASTASQLGGLGLSGFAVNQMLPQGYGASQALTGSSMFGFKKGGVANNRFAVGGSSVSGGANFISGITGGVPDVSVDYIPQVTMNSHGNLPNAPSSGAGGAGSSFGSSGGLGGLSGLSGLFKNNGIAPTSSSSFGGVDNLASSSGIDSLTGNNALTQSGINSSFLDSGKVASAGINFAGSKNGGVPHRDMGGMITNPQQAGVAAQNPMMQQQYSQYNNMSLNQLMQLATAQPNNPMIQRAMQQKKMSGGMATGGIAHRAFGGEVLPIVGDIAGAFIGDPGLGGQAQMGMNLLDKLYKGGVAGHYADGGSDADIAALQTLEDIAADPTGGVAVNNSAQDLTSNPKSNGIAPINESDVLPPDATGVAPPAIMKNTQDQPILEPKGELDKQPVVDHSGDTSKITDEKGQSIDTGLPSFKDTGPASNPWEPLLAAGLGIMAGRSPSALTNIGEGGLKGLEALQAQRQEALKENQAQAQSQQASKEADLRQKQIEQEKNQFDTKQTTVSATERAQLDLRNKEMQQQAAYQNAQIENQKLERMKPIPDGMGGFIQIDPATGQYKPVQGVGLNAGSGDGVSVQNAYNPPKDVNGRPLTGDAYYATLPPQVAAVAKQLANGDRPPITGYSAAKNPVLAAAQSAALIADPTYNERRYAEIQKFDVGKQGDQTRSFNTAAAHLDMLSNLTDALNTGDVKLINSAANAVKTQLGLSAAPTNFDSARQLVANEIIKATSGTGGGVFDREEVQKNLSSASSPAVLHSAIDNVYKPAIRGQLESLEQQYSAGTGLKNYKDKYLLPQTQKALGYGQQNNNTQPATIQPPAAAISMLKQNPALAAQFTQKYGVPAQQYLGQ